MPAILGKERDIICDAILNLIRQKNERPFCGSKLCNDPPTVTSTSFSVATFTTAPGSGVGNWLHRGASKVL
jgi:hypothetical protein